MHPYQVNDEIRQRVFILAGVVAIVLAWLLSIGIQNLSIMLPWWIETPSVLGFFGLFIWIYDRFLWKIWPFSKLSWFQTPAISGEWLVTIKSSYGKFIDTREACSVIRQTASKMCVTLQTEHSSSCSIYGILIRAEKLNTFEFIYHYTNEPKPGALDSMNIHHGTTWLRIAEDLNSMEGEYYSGRGRQQIGSIAFTRTKH